MDEPWDSPANRKVLETRTPTSRIPAPTWVRYNSAYFALTGPETVMAQGWQGRRLRRDHRRPSNTIAIVEAKRAHPLDQARGHPVRLEEAAAQARRVPAESDGFNAAFADGSVKFLKDSIDPALLA